MGEVVHWTRRSRNGRQIDPSLCAGNKDALREEQARILELLDRARKGDRNAIAALEARTGGTGVSEKIREAMPATKQAAKDQEEADKLDQAESDRRLKARQADSQKEVGFVEQEQARDQAESDRRLQRRKQRHQKEREEGKKETAEQPSTGCPAWRR